MSIGRYILWTITLCLGLMLIILVTRKTIENFDGNTTINTNSEVNLKQEITQYVTLANDTLCPCYTQILNQMIEDELPDTQKYLPPSDQDPDERHKAKATAITKLAQLTIPLIKLQPIDPTKVETLNFSLETTGLLFPCPPPTDPLQVPNTIDSYIEATVKVFLPKLQEMKEKIEKSLSCKKEGFSPIQEENEHFETSMDISVQKPYAEVHTPSKEDFDDVNNDTSNSAKQARIQALQLKATILKNILLSNEFITLNLHYKDLMKLKQSAESRQVTSNCSK